MFAPASFCYVVAQIAISINRGYDFFLNPIALSELNHFVPGRRDRNALDIPVAACVDFNVKRAFVDGDRIEEQF
jgi:hypothetical protein